MERNFDHSLALRDNFPLKIERLSDGNFFAAKAFLLSREKFCVSLCEKFPSSALRSQDGGFFFLISFQKRPCAAIFAKPNSLIFHSFDGDFLKACGFGDFGGENFARLKAAVSQVLRSCDFFGTAGDEFGSAVLLSAIQKNPQTVWRYFLMQQTKKTEVLSLPQGFSARKCGKGDFSLLLPLQAAYEKAEVVPENADFCEFSCRKRLLRAIEQGFLNAAFKGRVPVAKAAVNAVSQNFAQIGGVWTEKPHRSKGIASFLTQKLAQDIRAVGKNPVLFVKKSNFAAIRAYEKAGFSVFGSYELCYF